MAGGEGVGVRGFKMFCQNFFYLLCVYVCVCGGGGGGGVGVRGFKMFCQNFFYLLCVCVCGGGGGQVQYLSFREKNNRPPPINK